MRHAADTGAVPGPCDTERVIKLKWLKKWYYLLLFLGAGCLYLICAGGWKVYAEPVAEVYGWCRTLVVKAGGDTLDQPLRGAAVAGINRIWTGEKTADSGQKRDETDTDKTGQKADRIEGQGGETLGDGLQQAVEEGLTQTDDSQAEDGETDGPESDAPEEAGKREFSYKTVEDDYFADAVFIGDSRTVGMYEYGGLQEISAFYAVKGLTVYQVFDEEIVSVPGRKKKINIEQALQENTFAKIYLMIGINELGTGTVDTFMEKYGEMVSHLRELQPDAVIYLQGIMKVSSERSAKGDYINNESIEARNERIALLADNENVFYLDVNPLFCDETGGLISSYTFDGVHLKAKYIVMWKQFLKEHAIEYGGNS